MRQPDDWTETEASFIAMDKIIEDQKRQLEDKAMLINGVDKANGEMALEINELKAMVEILRVAAIFTDKEFRHHAKVESFETTVLSEALAKTQEQSLQSVKADVIKQIKADICMGMSHAELSGDDIVSYLNGEETKLREGEP